MSRRSMRVAVHSDSSSTSSEAYPRHPYDQTSSASSEYIGAAYVNDVTSSSDNNSAVLVNDAHYSSDSTLSGHEPAGNTRQLTLNGGVQVVVQGSDEDSDGGSTVTLTSPPSSPRLTTRTAIHFPDSHSIASSSSAGYQVSSASTRSIFSSMSDQESLDGVGASVEHRQKVLQKLAFKFRIEHISRSGGKFPKEMIHSKLSNFIQTLGIECETAELVARLRQNNLIVERKQYYLFKSIYVTNNSQEEVIYFGTTSKKSDSSTPSVYYVCLLCVRGFKSTRGLADHTNSASHTKNVKSKISEIYTLTHGKYECSMFNCEFVSHDKQEVERHLKQDKLKEFDTNLKTLKSVGIELLWRCEICNINISHSLKQQHCNGKKHSRNQFSTTYYRDRETQMQYKNDVEVVVREKSVLVAPSSAKTVTFQIINKSANASVSFLSCDLGYEIASVILSDTEGVARNSRPHDIAANGIYEVHMNVRPAYPGTTTIPVLFKFQRDYSTFEIMSETSVVCMNDPQMYSILQPSEQYKKPVKEKLKIRLEVVESDFLPLFEKNCSLEMTLPLDKYVIPQEVNSMLRRLSNKSLEENIIKELNLESVSFSNYSNFFNNLLHMEEFQMHIDIKHYTMKDVPMRMDSRSGLIRLQVPGLAENRPSVLRKDRLLASDGFKKYQGHVHDVQMLEVFLGFAKSLRDKFIDGSKYEIEFTINRLPHKVAHRAVSMAGEISCWLQYVLFPDPLTPTPMLRPLKPGNPKDISLRFCSTEIENNEQQKTAIQHIVCGTSRPSAYLIYGPPGTGKTFTLVEAIKQVYREYPTCRILACAPQNAAADLVTKRLLEHIDKKDILRIHALSRPYSTIEDKVKEVSNYKSDDSKHSFKGGNKDVYFPTKEELAKKRILVVTLVTAGRLVSAEMTDHFTHIFIDEAGHATEPETVIPLANLLNVNNGGQLVLAGDPKQLGPIIRSSVAVRGGLGISLLERLMDRVVYKKDKTTSSFNPKYVTKLVQSFRSHPDILKVPNECFYDSELLVYATKEQRERFCNWEGLPKKGFPLLFHGVNGKEDREKASPSWFNIHEVDVVLDYVKLLMECRSPKVEPQHIGIISPYHQQVNKITRGLKALEIQTPERTRNYSHIKVGSVEKFQGDEREVIIISTVRSQDAYLTHDKDFNLGFVGNPKRFNVAVTRSKALLILIGNPSILCRDKNWWKLIKHIKDGGGCKGFQLPDDFETMQSADDISEIVDSMAQLSTNAASSDEMFELDEASPYQQLSNQEWRRNDA